MQSEGKYFSILHGATGDSVTSAGTTLGLAKFTGSSNQLFCVDKSLNAIRCKANEEMSFTLQGSNVVLSPVNVSDVNQKWIVVGDHINHFEMKTCCIKVQGDNLVMGDFNNGPDEKFSFQYHKPQTFLICSMEDPNVCLDIAENNEKPGATVCLYKVSKDPNQTWWEDKEGIIRSCLNGFVLDTSEGPARMQPYDGSVAGRQWVRCGNVVTNLAHPGSCLMKHESTLKKAKDFMHIKKGFQKTFTEVRSEGRYGGGRDQQWIFKPC